MGMTTIREYFIPPGTVFEVVDAKTSVLLGVAECYGSTIGVRLTLRSDDAIVPPTRYRTELVLIEEDQA